MSRPRASTANWTEYLKAFGGLMYRPDVAPADAGSSTAVAPKPAQVPVTVSKPQPVAPSLLDESPAMKLSITNPLFESLTSKRR